MARESWMWREMGESGEVGLVGNLAKKQSTDLLCSWQSLGVGTHEPNSPTDTQRCLLSFCSVCVGMCRGREPRGSEVSDSGDLLV